MPPEFSGIFVLIPRFSEASSPLWWRYTGGRKKGLNEAGIINA
jgi:hypothetical protein